MNGSGSKLRRLSERGLENDPALATMVKVVNGLAGAVEARTLLGFGGGKVRRGSSGFTLRGGGVGGGGGGLLPPFYATGGRGKIRVEPGWVYDERWVGTMPRMEGVLLSERPVMNVGRTATGWLVLRVVIAVDLETVQPPDVTTIELLSGAPTCSWEEVVTTPDPYDVVTGLRVHSADFVWSVTGPDVLHEGVALSRDRVQVEVLAAKVTSGRVFSVLATDVEMATTSSGLVGSIWPAEEPFVGSGQWLRMTGFDFSRNVLG